jgi:hypothetical protein
VGRVRVRATVDLDPVGGIAVTEEWDMQGGRGFHPAADLFPEMSEEDYEQFKEDIRARGLMVPIITTKDGLILDGRHRWRACMDTKTEPRYQVYAGDPWEYVVSTNLHRRHLTTSQRAMIADRLREHARGRPAKSEQMSSLPRAASRQAAADLLKVSTRAVHEAGVVRKKGTPELAAAVDEGHVTVHAAAKAAETLKTTEQKEFIRKVRSGVSPPVALRAVPNPEPPVKEEKKRTRPTENIRRTVFRKQDAEGLSSMMTGIQLSFGDIVELTGVSRQEATYLDREIGKAKTVLNRIQKLLKEVPSE